MSELQNGVLGDCESESRGTEELEVCIRPPCEAVVLPWLAVLSSARVRYRVKLDGRGWAVWVPVEEVERAEEELREYLRANRDWPPPAAVLPYSEGEFDAATLASLSVAFGLVWFHRYTGPYSATVAFFAVGSADSSRIVAGEWWRTLTALTLHTDAGHVLANALCCVAFGRSVCRQLGTGVAWTLIGLTGAAANGLTACSVAAGHAAVGASTATFGALGILAGLQLVRNLGSLREGHRLRGRVWLPLGAAVGVLALLGSGARSDLLGHLWGIVVGVGAGCAAGGAMALGVGLAPQVVQAGVGAVGVVLLGGAWWAALSTL